MLQNWKLDKDRPISNTKLIFFRIRLYLYILMYYLYIFCNCIWLMRMSVNDEILTNYGYARQTMIKDVLGEHPQKIFNECFWMPGKLWVILYQLDCVLLKKNLHSHYQTSIIQLSYIVIPGDPRLLGSSQYWELH